MIKNLISRLVDSIKALFEPVLKSKLFIKYLTSYFLILVVGAGISFLSYFLSIRVIEKEIANAHVNSLTQLRNVIDMKIKELEQIYIQVGFDERTILFMNFPDSQKGTSAERERKIRIGFLPAKCVPLRRGGIPSPDAPEKVRAGNVLPVPEGYREPL